MKKTIYANLQTAGLLFLLCCIFLSCKKHDPTIPLSGYQQINLVASKAVFGAARVDYNLLNAWGLSADDEGEIWVSAADAGLSFVFDKTGAQKMPPVFIPSHVPKEPGAPTGNVYNETEDFIVPNSGEPAEFIFASEDGTVSAWNSGSAAVIVADKSAENASYKGITIANDGGSNFLYVTNFSSGKIDVFDKNFNYINKPFSDPTLPQGYAPFNIRNIGNMLFVTYALRTADGEEDSTGLGLGFVNVFWPNGTLAKHFAAHGTLNAPWGIAEARPGFCDINDAILIGNFGDGHINVFTLDGKFEGLLMNHGMPVAIDGLWAIDNDIPGISPKQLYFTAGPNDEEEGLFGFLIKQ